MNKWQPIETAPRNTPILIYANEQYGDRKIICVAELCSRNKSKYWNCIGASGYECENDFKDPPLFWMPLPESPKEEK